MRMKHFSQRLMMATFASALAITPCLSANTQGYEVPTRIAATASTEAVSILEAEGYEEGISLEWNFVKNATGYNVYYKSSNSSSYTLIDTELIRQYSSYMRADILGLKAGKYDVKIVPIINGAEASSSQAIETSLTVSNHDRSGFAFASASPMGTGSGGYNDDGSVPSDAQIIYITADTVNSVKLDVVTSTKGTTTSCTGLAEILTARQKGIDQRHLIIRVMGQITDSDISGLNSSGYLQIKNVYNTTLEGVGEDATVYGWGLLLREAHNVEVRNLGFMLFPDDGISIDTKNENIWVHNNDIFYGTAGSDADQAKGDGSCDMKGNSNYVTISYNHFVDSGKSSLCGMKNEDDFYATYHHNWFDHSDSRHPRIRKGSIHIYNNYFDGNSKYGVGLTYGGSAFVEANAFRNCKYPMMASMQGTDIASGNPTFSNETGGIIKAYNNLIEGAKALVYYQDDNEQFDAYLASSATEKVPSSIKAVSGGTCYNNFDTSSVMYDYTADAPEDVAAIVTANAGRLNGGDFTWTFTTADDTSYGIDAELMSAIKSYETDLVSVGGGSISTPDSDEVEDVTPDTPSDDTDDTDDTDKDETETPDTPEEDVTPDTPSDDASTSDHNFTTSGLDSSFFTITGSLSDSKGTVNYNGLTLTTCLKMESSTSIKFTTTATQELTLVFNSDFTGKVKIDGTSYTATNGIVTTTLKAGSHTITKGNTANLYYIELN